MFIYGPADIEGHWSPIDGRYYLIDTARVFPPVVPIKRFDCKEFLVSKYQSRKGAFLYNLFRQEFLKLNPVPLCSDAFSKFGKEDADAHAAEIAEATSRLER